MHTDLTGQGPVFSFCIAETMIFIHSRFVFSRSQGDFVFDQLTGAKYNYILSMKS